jgi:hypothetical protein
MAKTSKNRIIVESQKRDRHLLPCRDGISRMVELETIFILLDKSKKKRVEERKEENKKSIEEKIENALNLYIMFLLTVSGLYRLIYKILPIKDKYRNI